MQSSLLFVYVSHTLLQMLKNSNFSTLSLLLLNVQVHIFGIWSNLTN